MTVRPNELDASLAEIIREYTHEVSEGISDELDDTADKMLKEVQNTAPVGPTGEYKKGFRIKKQDISELSTRTIYNKPAPGLVHLLEYGHVVRNGTGKNSGKQRVEGRPHMRPAYDKYAGHLEDNIKKIIKNGGRK